MRQPASIDGLVMQLLTSADLPGDTASALLCLAGQEYEAAWRLGARTTLVVVPEAKDTRWAAQALLVLQVAGLADVLLGQAQHAALSQLGIELTAAPNDDGRWLFRTTRPQPWQRCGYKGL